MLHLGLLLFVPAIFAADNGNYGNYDGNNINANSNMVFNFEQLRRDQPPQIEMREENMGRYMYRPSTSEAPVQPTEVSETRPIPVNRRVENQPHEYSQLSNMLQPVDNRYNQQWNPNHDQSTTMPPPPPAPRLEDFADSFNNHAFSYFGNDLPDSLPASRNFYQHNHQSPTQQLNTKTPTTQDIRRNPMRQVTSQHPITPVISASTTAIPSRQPINRRFEEPTSRNSSPNNNRGHQKFNWNDLTTAQPQYNQAPQQLSTMAPAVNQEQRRPPPPAPTLSPWNDGFGKK